MKELLIKHGKGSHPQTTGEVRKIEEDNSFNEGWYNLQR